jgi:iron complex outermembrane receptor protein
VLNPSLTLTMGIRVTGIVMAVALLLSSGVQAQKASSANAPSKEKAEAKMHYDQGTVRFNLDEWPQAIEEFKAAYRVFPDATFLYNIAQCHRKMGNVTEALSFYRKYLRERPDAPNRAEVEKRIDELEASKAAQPVAPLPVAPAPAAVVPEPIASPAAPVAPPAAAPEASPSLGSAAPVAAQVPAPAGVDVTANAATTEPAGSDGILKKWWFWTAVGVAVVAGGVGTFLALSGTKSAKHYQGDMDPPVFTVPQ